MVAIIEAVPIALENNFLLSVHEFDRNEDGEKTYGYVNQCDAGSKIRIWVLFIDKSMLTPIADHHPNPHDDQR